MQSGTLTLCWDSILTSNFLFGESACYHPYKVIRMVIAVPSNPVGMYVLLGRSIRTGRASWGGRLPSTKNFFSSSARKSLGGARER